MASDRGQKARYVLALVFVLGGTVLGVRHAYARSKPTAEEALDLLRACPNSLSDRRHERWMESLDQLRAAHLDQVLAVANGTGALSCRGLAIVSAGGIAAGEPTVVRRVVLTLAPYLSHSDLWQAAIQGMIPIGAPANDELMPLLDTEDERTWKGLVVILQNINYSRLPEDSDLRAPGFPDTVEGRALISAAWREWWKNAKHENGSKQPGRRGSLHNYALQRTHSRVTPLAGKAQASRRAARR